MTLRLQRAGRLVAQHPRTVLCLWVLAAAFSAAASFQLPDLLVGGSGSLDRSPAQETAAKLQAQFDDPYADPLFVTIDAARLRVDEPQLDVLIHETAERLRKLASVRAVASCEELYDARSCAADPHRTVLLVGLTAADAASRERLVPVIRAALVPIRQALNRLDASTRLSVTGRAAISFDMNAWNAREGSRAETRALPVTLIILAMVFGSVVAAGLPLLTGLATTSLALGAAFLIAQHWPVSNLIENVITMVGLALGIDYSLLFLSYYRARSPGERPADAIALTFTDCGATILASGLAVSVGMLGLLLTPLLETRGMGIGGAIVAALSVLAALTLLPATLVLLGSRIERLRVPRLFLRSRPTRPVWSTLAAHVMAHPVRVLLLSSACVGGLALPAVWAHSGFTNAPGFLPTDMESSIGADVLKRMGNANAALSIDILLRATDGAAILAPSHLPALLDYGRRLASDVRVAAVVSPLSATTDRDARTPDPERALRDRSASDGLVSRDGSSALLRLTPAGKLSLPQVQGLARELGRTEMQPAGPFAISVGGTPAYYNDFDDQVWACLPNVIGFVIGAMLLTLFVVFRSYLLPLKAVAMNLLTVSAGYGSVVAVFQFGWLGSLFGPTFPSIPLTVPLMVFCFSFGISMDYEVFLLASIRREYRLSGDHSRATVQALAATGPVISGAALVMAVVFGAFAGADIALLQMIGLGLAVSVIVDATLVRLLLVPALMAIAGRWNWYPGIRY